MFPEQLKKILQLIKQTGDRVIIYDGSDPDASYVVMDVSRYLEIASSQTINKVTVSSDLNFDKPSEKTDFTEEKTENKELEPDLTDEDLTDKINQEISMWKNQDKASALAEEDKVKKSWQIPPAVKNKAHNIE